MKRILIFMLCLTMMTGLFSGCHASDEEGSTGSAVAESDTYELTIGHINDTEHTWHKMAEKFKEIIEEKSQGKITVTIYPNCELGSEIEMMESAIAGTSECDIIFTGESMQSYVEELGIIGMPYAVTNVEHMKAVLDGEVGDELEQIMCDAGLRSLGYVMRGPRNITSNKKIKNPDDLKGLIIRTPESPMTTAAFEALDMNAVEMPFSEIYDALEKKEIDAQENTLANIADADLYEVQKYVIETEHLYAWVYFAISEARFASFPEEVQAMIEEAAAEAVSYEHEEFIKNEKRIKEILTEKGMKFIKVEQEEFKEKVLSVQEGNLTEKQKELYEKIVAADSAKKTEEE